MRKVMVLIMFFCFISVNLFAEDKVITKIKKVSVGYQDYVYVYTEYDGDLHSCGSSGFFTMRRSDNNGTEEVDLSLSVLLTAFASQSDVEITSYGCRTNGTTTHNQLDSVAIQCASSSN